MIDDSWIERIKDGCNELVSEGLGHYLVSNEAGAIRALIIRLRQAEKDAARWRKLIEMNDDINCELAVCTWHGGYEYSMIPDISEVIDANIDETMNGSNN